MGTQGVKFCPDKSKIIEAIKKYKGVITHICKGLDVAHVTIINYINKDPELKQLMSEERNAFDDVLCDMGESVLIHSMRQTEDLSSALSAAKYSLNNKGRKRGYAPPNEKPETTENFSQISEAAVKGKIKQEDEPGNSV